MELLEKYVKPGDTMLIWAAAAVPFCPSPVCCSAGSAVGVDIDARRQDRRRKREINHVGDSSPASAAIWRIRLPDIRCRCREYRPQTRRDLLTKRRSALHETRYRLYHERYHRYKGRRRFWRASRINSRSSTAKRKEAGSPWLQS